MTIRFVIACLCALLVCSAGFPAGVLEENREQELAYRSSWSVVELAQANHVPPRKLAAALKVDFGNDSAASLSVLAVDEEAARIALNRYRGSESGLVRNIAFIGMTIVFASLIVVAFLISLLRHLHIFERTPSGPRGRKKSRRNRTGPIASSRPDMSDYALAAVVTAIFLHEEEVEAENRLLLTWKRASTSIWKAAKPMPNAVFYNARRGRT